MTRRIRWIGARPLTYQSLSMNVGFQVSRRVGGLAAVFRSNTTLRHNDDRYLIEAWPYVSSFSAMYTLLITAVPVVPERNKRRERSTRLRSTRMPWIRAPVR